MSYRTAMLSNRFRLLLAAGALAAGSIASSSAAEPPAPPAETIDELARNPDVQGWITAWRTVLPGIDVAKFRAAAPTPFLPFQTAKTKVVLRKGDDPRQRLQWMGVVVLSPGKTWAVGGDLWKEEPDSAIYGVDLRAGKSVRLLSGGTSSHYQVIAWLDAERFAVGGASCDTTCQLTVDLFDLEKKTSTTFQGPQATHPQEKQFEKAWLPWLKKRFPERRWPNGGS